MTAYECEICSYPLKIEDIFEDNGPKLKSFEPALPMYRAICPSCNNVTVVQP